MMLVMMMMVMVMAMVIVLLHFVLKASPQHILFPFVSPNNLCHFPNTFLISPTSLCHFAQKMGMISHSKIVNLPVLW